MRTNRNSILDWLFPRVRRRVLVVLLTQSQRQRHLREIARETGLAVSTVRRELEGLTQAGIATRTVSGNRTYFQANRECPVYPELGGLLRKTAGPAEVLREALAGLRNRVRIAFVYGSFARGQEGTSSDVDLLVIGQATFGQVVSRLSPAQDALGREINPIVYTVEEFRDKLRARHHFLVSVLDEKKIFLIGGDDELGNLGR